MQETEADHRRRIDAQTYGAPINDPAREAQINAWVEGATVEPPQSRPSPEVG